MGAKASDAGTTAAAGRGIAGGCSRSSAVWATAPSADFRSVFAER